MQNYKGEDIDRAEPSDPARVLGLKILPEVGDILEVGEGRRLKTKKLALNFNLNKPLLLVRLKMIL